VQAAQARGGGIKSLGLVGAGTASGLRTQNFEIQTKSPIREKRSRFFFRLMSRRCAAMQAGYRKGRAKALKAT
jgi:hypothetical protein